MEPTAFTGQGPGLFITRAKAQALKQGLSIYSGLTPQLQNLPKLPPRRCHIPSDLQHVKHLVQFHVILYRKICIIRSDLQLCMLSSTVTDLQAWITGTVADHI